MTAKRLLADVSCTPIRFQPGDRILVRCKYPLTAEQRRRVQRAVERWAGGQVEVLVIDLTKEEIEIVRGR